MINKTFTPESSSINRSGDDSEERNHTIDDENERTPLFHRELLNELQAVVLLQDAAEYRSINHRLDQIGISLHKFMFSKLWQMFVFGSIVLLHLLAFIEPPDSLSFSSNVTPNTTREIRETIPMTAVVVMESIFLALILFDAVLQGIIFGWKKTRRNPWLMLVLILLGISYIDIFFTLAFRLNYMFRVRRFFRPIFAIQKSQLMKKALKSLSKTLVDIMSVFILLALWLLAFTLIAVTMFNGAKTSIDENYSTFYGALFTLIVLITTANNPDAMVKVFNQNRLGFLFFLVFMVVGLFVFMNLLVAILFNEFRSHVRESMQTSRMRRRIAIRAMFEVLRKSPSSNSEDVDVNVLRKVIERSNLSFWCKTAILNNINSLGTDVLEWTHITFVLSPMDDHNANRKIYEVPKLTNSRALMMQRFFLSKVFEIIGLILCIANVIVIAVDVTLWNMSDSSAVKLSLNVLNWIFISLYVVEQACKMWAMSPRTFFSKRGCVYDFTVTVIIMLMKISVEIAIHINSQIKISNTIIMSDLPRITNLIILLRASRIILFIPSLTPVISTLFEVPWRLKSIIGILIVIFYEYALLGMIIFRDAINWDFYKNQTGCGEYRQLEYGGLNFNDFYSSIVVLWCLLIVNNWQVFVSTFSKAMNTKLVHLYMISWWIIAVIVVMNCVTAFVIEGYTQRKQLFEEEKERRSRPYTITEFMDESIQYLRQSVVVNESFTFQMLFKEDLVEPTENEMMSKLKRCKYLCNYYPHIPHSRCASQLE